MPSPSVTHPAPGPTARPGRRSARAARGSLLVLGVTFGALLLPLSLQIAVAGAAFAAPGRTLLQLLYPLALALGGAGAALQARVGGHPDRWARASGAAMLLFLATLLRVGLDPGPDLAVRLVLVSGALFTALTASGGAVAGALTGSGAPGQGWLWHAAGLAVGYAACSPLIEQVGGNALIFVGGVALLMAGARVESLLGMLVIGGALAVGAGLDRSIERERVASRSTEDEPLRRESMRGRLADAAYIGWSRYGQLAVVERQDPLRWSILSNRARQYTVSAADFDASASGGNRAVRRGVYGQLGATDRALVIGMGSGRGLVSIPGLDHRVTGVERDPAAFHWFADVNPDANAHVYERFDARNEDGRHALSSLPGGWALIAYESAIYQPETQLLPATTPYYLLTAEALALSLDRLAPDGLLAIELLEVGDGRHAALPAHVNAWMQAQGVPAYALTDPAEAGDSWTLVAAHTPEVLDRWLTPVRALGEVTVSPLPPVEDDAPDLRDRRPFLTWLGMEPEARSALLGAAVGLALLPLLALGALTGRAPRRDRAAYAWFAAVGAGGYALQLHAFLVARSLLGDELGTALTLIVAFLLWGAIGARAALTGSRTPTQERGIALGLGVAWVVALACIPDLTTSTALRWAWAIVATAPGGMLAGIGLPLGLGRVPSSVVAGALAADAAGTLFGYAASWLLLLPFGVPAYGAFAAVTLTAVAVTLPPPRG